MSDLDIQDLCYVLAEHLKKLRDLRSLNQMEMAQSIGSYQGNYSLVEKGERELTSIQLYKLAVTYNVDLNWLMGLSTNPVNVNAKTQHQANVAQKEKRRKTFKDAVVFKTKFELHRELIEQRRKLRELEKQNKGKPEE